MPRGNPYDRKITTTKKTPAPPKKADAPTRSVPSDRPTALQRGLRAFGEYASGADDRARASGKRPTALQRGLSAVGERLSSSRRTSSPKPKSTTGVTVASGRLADVMKPTPPKTPAKSTPSTSRASTAASPPRMTAAERQANAQRSTSPALKTAPKTKVTVSEARPAYANVSAPPTTRAPRDKYPTYSRTSKSAESFRTAFSRARKKGLKEFSWMGDDGVSRKYTTDIAPSKPKK